MALYQLGDALRAYHEWKKETKYNAGDKAAASGMYPHDIKHIVQQ